MIVIDSFAPGGAETSTAAVLPLLRDLGLRVRVVCLRRTGGALERKVLDDGHDVVFSSDAPGRSPLRAIRGEVRAFDPDLVHAILTRASWAARLSTLRMGVPVLVSLVRVGFGSDRRSDASVGAVQFWSVYAAERWLGRRLTTHYHAVSGAVRDDAVRALRLPPEMLTIVERGRDAEGFAEVEPGDRDAAQAALGLAAEDELVVAVGRIASMKGHETLVDAIAALRSSRPDLRAVIIGPDGSATPRVTARISDLGLTDRVRLVGYRADVPALLPRADVFVLPSIHEGFPGVVIEAMATGLPIVSSAIPAVEGLLEHEENSLLVPHSCPAPLAEALDWLLGDRALAHRLGARARSDFRERFTLDRIAARTVQMYEDVAGGAP